MQIKAEEISKIIEGQIQNYEQRVEMTEVGTVLYVGDGIARVDGEVVFLPGTLPGEKLIGRITAEKKNASSPEFVGEIRFREFAKLVI